MNRARLFCYPAQTGEGAPSILGGSLFPPRPLALPVCFLEDSF